jgi:hypothetical protein
VNAFTSQLALHRDLQHDLNVISEKDQKVAQDHFLPLLSDMFNGQKGDFKPFALFKLT